MKSDLQSQWEYLLQVFGISGVQAQAHFAALEREYSSPGRVYHTLDHIQAMLTWIERLRDEARHFAAIQLATWFHDCIYDPRANDNEEQSARYAVDVLTGLAVPDATIQIVSRLILATKTHQVPEDLSDSQILLDADLAILGAPLADYEAYAAAIRQEYSWVPGETYRAARTRVLRTFLQRPRIYQTARMSTWLEKTARENLQREMHALT